MKAERKALVLCHIQSRLLIKNLEVALHEAKISKNPLFKSMGKDLSKLKFATNNAFRTIDKEVRAMGGMESVENEVDNIVNQIWLDPDIKLEDDGIEQ